MKTDNRPLGILSEDLLDKSTRLPLYAFPYAHPASGNGDVGAEFYSDDGMTICVSIERCDEGMVTLDIHRGGIGENLFTRGELAKVLELAGILLAANGKQPPRGESINVNAINNPKGVQS